MANIDYAAIKAAVTMEQAIAYLNLTMKREGDAYRSACPTCQKGGPRALVVTPSKAAWYCFHTKRGGDVVALVAHIHGCGQRDAAAMLQEHFLGSDTAAVERQGSSISRKRESPPAPEKNESHQDLAAQLAKIAGRLQFDHEVLGIMGLTEVVCRALGIGFDPKYKRVMFPLFNGLEHVGYGGLATSEDQVPLMLFNKNLAALCAAPTAQEKPKDSAEALRKMFRVVA